MDKEELCLVGGPQDGAKVCRTGRLPEKIYVGSKWLGDGYAAWSQEQCARFPCCYERFGDRYVFGGYGIQTKGEKWQPA